MWRMIRWRMIRWRMIMWRMIRWRMMRWRMIRWRMIRWRMGWMTGRAAAACAGSVRPDMGPGGWRAYIMLSKLTFFLYVDFYACFYIWEEVFLASFF